MGLLDDFSGFIKTPEGQGLLSAAFGAAASARQNRPWNTAGAAGLAGIQGYANAQDQQAQMKMADQMAQIRQGQIDHLNAQNNFRKQIPSMDMSSPDFIKNAVAGGALDIGAALPLMIKDNKTTWQDVGDKFVQLDNSGRPTGMEMPKGIAPSIHTLDTGGTTGLYQVGVGGVSPLVQAKKTQTPDSAASVATTIRGQNMTDSRDRAINGIDVNGNPTGDIEAMAQGIAAQRLAPLTGWALNRPRGQQIMSRVMEINPDFNAADFNTQKKAMADFSSGKLGSQVRSFNVSLNHLDQLGQLSDALDNGNIQAINKVGNKVSEWTGGPAVTNFDAAKKIVADEVVKAIVGSGGGVADREEAARTINSAQSPAQLKGAISTYKHLMNGQLSGLRQQYEQSTGRNDFDRFLSDAARAEVTNEKKSAMSGGGWSAKVVGK